MGCAWAQVNDPDPELWVTFYLLCGTATGLAGSLAPQAAAQWRARLLTASFFLCTIVSGLVALELRDAVPAPPFTEVLSLLKSQAVKPAFDATGAWCWGLLELEQGRELVGVLLLGLHNLLLRLLLRSNPACPNTNKKKNGSSKETTNASSCVSSTGMAQVLGLGAMTAALALAVYAWVLYQPLMNAKHNTPHCNGAFEDPFSPSPPSPPSSSQ